MPLSPLTINMFDIIHFRQKSKYFKQISKCNSTLVLKTKKDEQILKPEIGEKVHQYVRRNFQKSYS